MNIYILYSAFSEDQSAVISLPLVNRQNHVASFRYALQTATFNLQREYEEPGIIVAEQMLQQILHKKLSIFFQTAHNNRFKFSTHPHYRANKK